MEGRVVRAELNTCNEEQYHRSLAVSRWYVISYSFIYSFYFYIN